MRDYTLLPYSKEEKIVSDDLINMYFDFSSKNLANYGNIKFEMCKPKSVKYVEISGPHDYKITPTDEHFGNVLFWDEIESILASSERTFFDEL